MTSKEGSHPRATFLLHTGYLPTASVKYPSLGSLVASEIGDPKSQLPSFVRIGGRGGIAAAADSWACNSIRSTCKTRARRRPIRGRPPTWLAISGGWSCSIGCKADFRTRAPAGGGRSQEALRSRREDDPEPGDEGLRLGPGTAESMREAYGSTQFGAGCLLARRLVEAGVTFVEVTSNGWDTHDDNFDRSQSACRAGRSAVRAIDSRPQGRGMLDTHARGVDGRVRPHAEHQSARRPRSLSARIQRGAGRRRHSRRAGHRRDRRRRRRRRKIGR